jgi:signal transduction histidine kinase
MTEPSLLAVLLADEREIAVLVVEEDVITAANRAARRVLGPRAMAGTRIAELFDEPSQERLAQALSEATPNEWVLHVSQRAGRRAFEVRFLVVPEGTRCVLFETPSSARLAEAVAQQFAEVSSQLANLTRELARRTAEVEAARTRLEELGALRDQFIAALSHDIRSPLHAICLAAELCERYALQLPPEELAQRARLIQRNGERITQVIENVLEAARLEHRALEIERRSVSLLEVARSVADALGPVATDAEVRLAVDDATGGTAWVLGDRIQLFRVLSNLVTNAIRHSPRGGVVTLHLEQDEGHVRCAVRDEGPGVPGEAREHIFARYSQGGPKPGAAGLGLYVARQILELHGGRIWVEDRPLGSGASFLCELPRPLPPGGGREDGRG